MPPFMIVTQESESITSRDSEVGDSAPVLEYSHDSEDKQ